MLVMNASFQLLSAHNMEERLTRLRGQFAELLHTGDAPSLHQLRVAARRLRAALRLCRNIFPGKSLRKWQKLLKSITRDFGAARDLDVQIRFIAEFLETTPEKLYHPGLERLLLRLRQARQRLQPSIMNAAEALSQSDTLKDMGAQLEHFHFELKHKNVALVLHALAKRARKDMLAAYHLLISRETCLDHPEQTQTLHRLRIAVKRARYAAEFYRTVFPELDRFIKSLKKMQTQLGRIHDADLWILRLPKFCDEERARTLAYFGHTRPFARLKPGLEYLDHYLRRRRDALFTDFLPVWHTLRHTGLADSFFEVPS